MPELGILVRKGPLHTHVRHITQMPLHNLANFNLPILKHQCLHRIKGEIHAQVTRIVVLELDSVVPVLILDDLLAELRPGREVHPRRVRDHELRRPRSLPVMQRLVGGVCGRDLPLHEAVHAHEGGELFGDQLEAPVREDGGVTGHYFGEG